MARFATLLKVFQKFFWKSTIPKNEKKNNASGNKKKNIEKEKMKVPLLNKAPSNCSFRFFSVAGVSGALDGSCSSANNIVFLLTMNWVGESID